MTAKELILELQKMPPEHDVIFWDGEDNYDILEVVEDSVNQSEVILSQ